MSPAFALLYSSACFPFRVPRVVCTTTSSTPSLQGAVGEKRSLCPLTASTSLSECKDTEFPPNEKEFSLFSFPPFSVRSVSVGFTPLNRSCSTLSATSSAVVYFHPIIRETPRQNVSSTFFSFLTAISAMVLAVMSPPLFLAISSAISLRRSLPCLPEYCASTSSRKASSLPSPVSSGYSSRTLSMNGFTISSFSNTSFICCHSSGALLRFISPHR